MTLYTTISVLSSQRAIVDNLIIFGWEGLNWGSKLTVFTSLMFGFVEHSYKAQNIENLINLEVWIVWARV